MELKPSLTLISLKGMSKLLSSLESNPNSLAARLKFLLVAASAFMVSPLRSLVFQNAEQEILTAKQRKHN